MIGKRHWNYTRRFQAFIANTDLIASDAHFWTLIDEIKLLTDPLVEMCSKLYVELLNFMFFEVTYEEMDAFVTGLLKIVRNLLALQPTSWFQKPIAAVRIISRLEEMRCGAVKLLSLFVHPHEYYRVNEEGRDYYDNLLKKIDATLDTVQTVVFQIIDKAGPDRLLEYDNDAHLLRVLIEARTKEPVKEATLDLFIDNAVSPLLVEKVLRPEIWTWYEEILRDEESCSLCGHCIEEGQPSDCIITAGCEHLYCCRCMPRLQRPIDSLCRVVICEKEMQYYTSMQVVHEFQEYKRRRDEEERLRRERRLAFEQFLIRSAASRHTPAQSAEEPHGEAEAESTSDAAPGQAAGPI